MRWYIAGGVLALAGIACAVIGDYAIRQGLTAEAWAETSKEPEKPDDGVHGLSGE